MRSFVILLTLCTVAMAAEPVAQEREVTDEEKANAKSLGEVVISDAKPIEVGTIYVGTQLKGRLSVTNDTGEVLKITGMTTTCGCTGGYPSRKEIPDGEAFDLMLQVKPTRAETIGVTVKLKTNGGTFPIRLGGHAKLPVVLAEPFMKIGKDAEVAAVKILVADSKINPAHVAILYRGKKLKRAGIDDRTLTVELPIADVNLRTQIPLTPILRKSRLHEIQIQIQRQGASKLATDQVYVTDNSFRLFVVGDPNIDAGETKAELSDGDFQIDVVLKANVNKTATLLQCSFDSDRRFSGHSVTLTLANESYDFQLHTR